MLINKNEILYISTYNNRTSTNVPEPIKKVHGGYPGTGVRDWEDRDYWYVEFVNGDAFYHYPIEKIVPIDILDKIKSGKIILCICHLHEAYHYVIKHIYEDVIIKSGIPVTSILYLTNAIDIGIEIDIVSKQYSLPKIETEFISLMEYVGQTEYKNNSNNFTKNTLSNKFYEKKFICLNGRWSPHRVSLVSFLSIFDLLNLGFISYNTVPGENPTNEQDYESLLNWYSFDKNIENLILQNKEKIIKLNRIYFDTTYETHYNKASYESTGTYIYENSYFTVVTESLCNLEHGCEYQYGRTLSEKTFRAILNLSPFIILARPKTLKLLHFLGYKTFSPLIDESYDDEFNDELRIFKVAKEIERLSKLNTDELNHFLLHARQIAEYNLNVLVNKQKFSYSIT